MVLGIVETENSNLGTSPPEQKLQSEVLALKSSKEQMESMVIEMRNNMREMEKRMADADSNTSKLINSLQRGEITQKQLKIEMEALLRIKGDVDFERKLAESQERLAAMGVVSPNKKKRKESHRFDTSSISSSSDLAGSEALARVYATLGDDAKQLMIEAATPTSKKIASARDDPNSTYYVPTVQIPDPILRKLESPPDPVRVTSEVQEKEELFDYPEPEEQKPKPADFMRNSLLNSLLDTAAGDDDDDKNDDTKDNEDHQDNDNKEEGNKEQKLVADEPAPSMSQLSSLLDAAAEEQNTLNPIADIASEEGSPNDHNDEQLTELSRPPSEEQVRTRY